MRIALAEVTVAGVSDALARADLDMIDEPRTDGRVARRERNVAAVLDAVIEMFSEGDLNPSIERVASRTGLSLRSVYRYFPDPSAMHDAAIARHRARVEPIATIPAIGTGSLEHRIDALVEVRLRLYDHVAATYLATVHNAPRSPRLSAELMRGRSELRAQVGEQFASELDAFGDDREAIAMAVDALTQLDSIDLLRRHRALPLTDAAAQLRTVLHRLLGGTHA